MKHNIRRTAYEVFAKLPKLPETTGAKILHLTHTDLDGEGAAMALSMLPYDIEVRRLTNNNMSYEIGKVFITNESNNYDFIIVTDISCSKKVCDIINKHPDAKKFIILDHHQTSDYLNDYPFGVCQSVILSDSVMTEEYRCYFDRKDKLSEFETADLHSSGTSLMVDYLWYHKLFEVLPTKKVDLFKVFANYVRCYDTWDWKLCFDNNAYVAPCPLFNTLYDAYGANNFSRKIFRNMYQTLRRPASEMDDMFGFDESDILYDDDMFIIQCEQDKMAQFVESVKEHVRTGNLVIPDEMNETKYYSVAYISCNRYLQEVFDMMKENYADTDIYIINYGSGLSFRVTREDINIGQLVTLWGGGGHPGAAGVKIPGELMDNLVCNDVLTGKLILNEKEKE